MRQPRQLPWRPWSAGVIVASACLWRIGYYLNQPDNLIIGVIPDDAFYYLQLARNRVETGLWTFDGTAPTTGFHPLHAYALVLLDGVLGPRGQDWRLMFAVVGVLGALCVGVAAALVAAAAVRVHGADAAWWAPVAFLTPVAVTMPTLLMEAQWVILASAATIFVVARGGMPRPTAVIGLLGLGVAGSLARTDYGLLPAAITLAFLVLDRADRARVRRAALVLVGSIAGVGAGMVHNYATAGTFLQSSARIKLRWSAQSGFDPAVPLSRLVGSILPLQFEWAPMRRWFLLAAALAFFLTCVVAIGVAGRRLGIRSTWEPLGAGCLITLLGYVAVHSFNTQGMQIWYDALFTAPVAYLVATMGMLLAKPLRRWGGAAVGSAFLVVTTIGTASPLWPWQADMLEASTRLSAMPIDHVGSWNAGILGFTSGKVVTNLDGLVNDDVVPYLERGELYDYVRHRGIEYLVDHAGTISDASVGAGPDSELYQCFAEETALSGDEVGTSTGRVVPFTLQPRCR